MVEAIEGADVGDLSFDRVVQSAADTGLFSMVGEGHSIDHGGLCWDFKGSEMGGPAGCLSGLIFAPAPSPMVKIC